MSHFNTQWSPSSGQFLANDDIDFSEQKRPGPGGCYTTDSEQRDEKQLGESAQRRVGAAYISAFYRRYLSGETRFDPMLTGKQHPLSHVARVDVGSAQPKPLPQESVE
ncbi:hypothetical protein [Streptomyces sp. KR80]|uniref:hypothetical protein n=1 Tax=Streptomyces sp. KR80 TaxID=3457426 RepID=UPI003FD23124